MGMEACAGVHHWACEFANFGLMQTRGAHWLAVRIQQPGGLPGFEERRS